MGVWRTHGLFAFACEKRRFVFSPSDTNASSTLLHPCNNLAAFLVWRRRALVARACLRLGLTLPQGERMTNPRNSSAERWFHYLASCVARQARTHHRRGRKRGRSRSPTRWLILAIAKLALLDHFDHGLLNVIEEVQRLAPSARATEVAVRHSRSAPSRRLVRNASNPRSSFTPPRSSTCIWASATQANAC